MSKPGPVMKPTIPRQELQDLLGQLAGCACFWSDDAHGQETEAWIELSPGAVTTVGAEYRQRPDPKSTNHTLESKVVDYTTFVVTVHAKSFNAKRQAYDLCKAIHMALRGVTAAAAYADANIALVDVHPIAPFRGTMGAGRRARLDATMDIVFATVGEFTPQDDDGATIGQVNGGGVIPITTS